MSDFTTEIQKLQLRITELEKQKQKFENTSFDHNINLINVILDEKKNQINRNTYSKSKPLAKWNDEQLVKRLQAIYNILKNLDERLSKIEEK